MSSTARLILDTLDKMSTPIQVTWQLNYFARKKMIKMLEQNVEN